MKTASLYHLETRTEKSSTLCCEFALNLSEKFHENVKVISTSQVQLNFGNNYCMGSEKSEEFG